MESIRVEIADLAVVVEGEPRGLGELREAWAAFVGAGDAAIRIEVERLPGEADRSQVLATPRVRRLGDSIEVGQGEVYTLELQADAAGAQRRGRLRYRACRADADAGQRPAGLRGALTTLWSLLLPERGGMLMHAAAARFDDRGVAFLGQSGAGKSTLAGTLPLDDVFTDELVAARPAAGGWGLWSTPFNGRQQVPRRRQQARWAAGFELQQAPRTSCAALGRVEALRLLLACTSVAEGDDQADRAAFAAATSVVESVPWGTLAFRKDGQGVAEAVRRFCDQR